jgi:hypothetical protein
MGSATSSGTGVYGEVIRELVCVEKEVSSPAFLKSDVEVTVVLTVSGKNVDTRLTDLENRILDLLKIVKAFAARFYS